jgi:adenosine deaminase
VSLIQKLPLLKPIPTVSCPLSNLKTQLSAIIKPLSQIPTKSTRKSHKSLKKVKKNVAAFKSKQIMT